MSLVSRRPPPSPAGILIFSVFWFAVFPRSALVGTPFSPASVAQAMVSGLSHRHYHLPSPDFLQNRLVDTMVGVTPRNNAVLEWMTLPVLALVEWLFLRWPALALLLPLPACMEPPASYLAAGVPGDDAIMMSKS